MTFLFYNLLGFAASPLLAGYIIYRALFKAPTRRGFWQRLGWVPALGKPPEAGRVWLHAVSAGEGGAPSPIAPRPPGGRPRIGPGISTTPPPRMEEAPRPP